MADEVDDLWRSIMEWLRSHAPATAAGIRPPATDAALSSVIAALERPLPADLQRWWRLADGMTRGVLDPLIPSIYTPLPLADALEIRQFSLKLEDDIMGSVEVLDGDQVDESYDMAGPPCYGFHPLFVPIAEDHCGDTMFVDLREGSQHGCIGVWDPESDWDDGVCWESVTDMLTDVRDALLHGEPAMVAYAERRQQHFAGLAVDAAIWRAEVDSRDRLTWTPQEVGSRR
jgi:cell wall assembly regulator SMI1